MVVVIGSLNLDRTVVLERCPGPGETVPGLSYMETTGGKGGNVAAQAARLGSPTRLLACTGTDSAAKTVLEAHAALHVDLAWIQQRPSVPTGTASIWVERSGGENRIVVVPGANANVDAALVEEASAGGLLDGATCLVMNLEIPESAVRAGLLVAHARGVPVLLNRSPAPGPDTGGGLGPDRLAANDFLVVNRPEAHDLIGARDEGQRDALGQKTRSPTALAAELATRTEAQVVVTAGAQGAATAGPFGCHTLPALNVHATDTTGAGDAFLGALAFGVDQGVPLPEALQIAGLAAAHAVTRPGALTAQADRQALICLAAAQGVRLPPVLTGP